ncbi:MAG: sensor histidine kinase N-terminal domain-containing protein [Burkholderiaceae bacterium]|nr:sensor histidine kinase N-terminal domain-containing protein [Burkholderiaceae bacterium]
MRWKRDRHATLRARLLRLLIPGALLVLGVGLWTTRGDAIRAADAAFDRSLLGAIKGLDLNVSTASGGLSVEQPYRLFEFFELTASGTVHYRVATDDGLVEIGSPDLPLPARPLKDGEPQFYDAAYLGQPVRVGALRRPLEPPVGGSKRVLIQVAETTDARERFARTFVRQAVARDAVLLGTLVIGVALVSTWALLPLRRLAEATARRAPDDLRPLPADGLPQDLVPLVDTINGQITRTSTLLDQRRRFLDDASHQLRTPLTTLRAQLDYARREVDPAQARAAIEALSDELDHATRATNQLLALARTDSGPLQPEMFDLHGLAREVALMLLPQARAAGIDFGVDDLGDALLPAHGDRLQLREALLNLAHNALLHGAGPVTIEAGAESATRWRLGVVDAGPGLAADVQARAGERFAKGRGSRGSGLGLAMARAVAERHGGLLVLEPGDDGRGLRAYLVWGAT